MFTFRIINLQIISIYKRTRNLIPHKNLMSEVEIIIKIYVGLHFLRVTMEKWKEKKKRRKSDEEILKKTI